MFISMDLATVDTSGYSGPAWWVTLLIAVIPAVASIVAAVIATRSAKSARLGQAETERIRDLENRISERKYETYRPMLQMLGDAFNQEKLKQLAADPAKNIDRFGDFTTWITIYGSDEAVRAFHNFTQSASYDPPDLVSVRLIADFILAARKDIGYRDTDVTKTQLIAMRIKDFYDEDKFKTAMTLPLDEVCEREGWIPPWSRNEIPQP
jgi:hypothetical protein